ncbi:MAG: fibronectin type III domain-containing protein [Thaumarchaeota archaeon]|nr:fibronectin type III domain-containing protein [Nitrososphaerota archaeon]
MLMKAGRNGTGRALPIPGSYALAAAVVVAVATVALAAASLASGAYAALEFAHMFDDEDIDGGAIDGPYDVALSENGRDVYVVEKNKDRISIFSKDGSFDDRFGSTGTRNLEFSDPVSIIRPDRLFFVLDAGNNRIQVVDKDGTFEREFDSDRLSSPTDIAMDTATQRVFISDAGGDRIHVFSPDGTYKGEIKKFNTTDMSDPSGLVVDVLGRYLYVSDTGKHRIGIFSILTETQDCRNGTVETKAPGICYVGEFGTAGIVGTANGTFNGPTGLAIDKKAVPNRGELYVSDTGNARIQIFSFLERGGGTSCPDGTQNLTDVVCYVGKYGSFGDDNGKFKSPHGIAIDTKNRLLYVADTGNNRVQVIKLDAQSASLSPQSGTSGGGSSSSSSTTTTVQKPNPPHNVRAVPISPTSILVDWDEPRQRGDSVLPIIGYAVEYKSKAATGTSVTDFTTITSRTSTNATALYHTDLDPGTTYTYRVSAVASGADAVSTPSTTAPTQPAETTTPTMVDIVAMSPTYVKMTWLPPSNTYNQPLNGYVVQEKIGRSYFTVDDGEVGRSQLSFTYNVDVDSDNSFHVYAKIGDASTPPSNPVSISTVGSPFHTGVIEPYSVKLVSMSAPSPPIKVSAKPVNDRHIEVTWSPPADDGNLAVTGYTVEAKKKGSSSFTEIASSVTGTKYAHRGLEPGSEYAYRVYATNAQGTSGASNESTAEARIVGLVINSVGSLTVDEGKPATFIVTVSGDASSGAALSLANEPEGASIVPQTGAFSWTPSYDQGGKTYTFDVVAARGEHSDKKTVRIKVNDVPDADVEQQQQPQTRSEEPRDAQQPDAGTGLAPFVDESVDPQTYVDRYNAEPSYKEWYDANYLAEYGSIYDAVGVLQVPASFVDESVDPQTYVDRYNSEPSYKEWFDAHYSEYDSIYHAVGLDDPAAADDTSGGAVGGDGDGAGTGEPALDETDSGETPDEPARPELRLDVPLAPFVDESVDPQTYVDRYNSEPSYKEWFDANYAGEYGTIYRAVGLFEIPAPFVDESVDPQTYVDRYNAEPSYKEWFDQNYAEYFSIYHAVGLPEPDVEEPEPPAKQYGICGPGTKLIEGVCTIVNNE